MILLLKSPAEYDSDEVLKSLLFCAYQVKSEIMQ